MKNISGKYTFPFFESIRIEDGQLQNTKYHLQRMMLTCLGAFGSFKFSHLFEDFIIPEEFRDEISKLKLYYNESRWDFEIFSYQRKPVESLQMVDAKDLIYERKYTQRLAIEELTRDKGQCDDILIIKEGLVTDTSIANIVFFHDNVLLTPADCLLAGTERQRLLKEGIADAVRIRTEDIPYFDGFCIINAMNPLGCRPVSPVKNILPI